MREGWHTKKLGELGRVITGSTPSTRDEDNYSSPDVCFVKPSDIEKNGITTISNTEFHISHKAFQQSRKLPQGSVLTTCIGIIGKVGILGVDATCNQQINAIVPDIRVITSSFLAYSILSKQHLLSSIANAPVVPIINKGEFSSVAIPVPPIAEQEKIVAELDCLSGIIEKKKQQLKELGNLAQSIFYDMFGDPIANEKGWETSNIGSFCTDVRYGTSRPACDGGKYAYLRMGNLTYEGNIDLTDIKRIDIPDTEIEKCIVRKGDVLFNRTNSLDLVGKTCLFDLDEEMVIAGYIIRVRLNRSVLPVYLVRTLNTSRYKKVFRTLAKGAVNQANINAKEFQSVVVPVPPLDLQNAFTQKIEAIEKQKELIKKSIQETETLFNSRMDYWFN